MMLDLLTTTCLLASGKHVVHGIDTAHVSGYCQTSDEVETSRLPVIVLHIGGLFYQGITILVVVAGVLNVAQLVKNKHRCLVIILVCALARTR